MCAVLGCRAYSVHGLAVCEEHYEALPAELRDGLQEARQMVEGKQPGGWKKSYLAVRAANEHFAREPLLVSDPLNGATEWTG